MIYDIPTPCVLIDNGALERNLRTMQDRCDQTGTKLWPHCKTHKMVPVLKRQLALGAAGATVAKIGEAEALLPSGVRNIFIAHSIVRPDAAPRLKALDAHLDRLILAVTSEAQLESLEKVLDLAGISAGALLSVDTGLTREGARTPESAAHLAGRIRESKHLTLSGIYTHEGHAYQLTPPEMIPFVEGIHRKLLEFRDAVGGGLPLWPGCSITAMLFAGREAVEVVRPGSYVFGDLSLCESAPILPWEDAALNILATVIDLPEPGLALIDAGSKVFSSDRSAAGIFGRGRDHKHLTVSRLSEEHGFVTWVDGPSPAIGDVLHFIPAHVCPVVNLASEVHVFEGTEYIETWRVDGRGRST